MVGKVNRVRLGEALIAAGVLTDEQLGVALDEKKQSHRPLGEVLLALGLARPEEVGAALAQGMGIPFLRAKEIEPDPLLVSVLDPDFIRETGAVPIRMEGGVLKVAMVDPSDSKRVASVRARFRAPVDLHLITEADFDVLVRRMRGKTAGPLATVLEGTASDDDFSVERVVQALFEDALSCGATDLHLEPEEDLVRVRYRVDGVLESRETLPSRHTAGLISRIKILAGLDISEHRRPQDGRIRARVHDRDLDMRLSVMPSAHGENVVLRLLDGQAGGVTLGELGMHGRNMRVLKAIPQRSHGLFLVTGPTGSGKSTTLYAMLAEVDAIRRKVVTIENPIEYSMPLVRQSQVDTSIGFTFHEGLRAILRQDPDVILVGEIRDQETADMAVKASMTGHLVFATLHTNTAVGSVSRLIDLGIPPYLIEDSLIGSLGQRLVRKICDACAEEVEPDARLARLLGEQLGTLRKGRGCELCNGSGYSGRTVIGEVFLPDEDFAACMRNGYDPMALNELVANGSMQSLFEDGLSKVRMGITTIDEVDRVGLGHRLTEGDLADL